MGEIHDVCIIKSTVCNLCQKPQYQNSLLCLLCTHSDIVHFYNWNSICSNFNWVLVVKMCLNIEEHFNLIFHFGHLIQNALVCNLCRKQYWNSLTINTALVPVSFVFATYYKMYYFQSSYHTETIMQLYVWTWHDTNKIFSGVFL